MRKEAPEPLATNVNEWFHNKPERRMIRTLDGQARAFLSDRYRRLDNYDLASTVLPILIEIRLNKEDNFFVSLEPLFTTC